jgi:hypothetical protein
MTSTGHTLVVQAWIDRDFDTETAWVGRLLGDAPFHGLFATGADFADARRNVARMVLEAYRAFQPGITVDAVRVVASTRKTFPVADLAGAGQ